MQCMQCAGGPGAACSCMCPKLPGRVLRCTPGGTSTALLSLRRWLGTARSRVGQKLSDLTSQRVVVGILTMLFFIPGFASNYMLWGTYTSLAGGGLQMLHDLFIAQGNSSSFVTVRCLAIPALTCARVSIPSQTGFRTLSWGSLELRNHVMQLCRHMHERATDAACATGR